MHLYRGKGRLLTLSSIQTRQKNQIHLERPDANPGKNIPTQADHAASAMNGTGSGEQRKRELPHNHGPAPALPLAGARTSTGRHSHVPQAEYTPQGRYRRKEGRKPQSVLSGAFQDQNHVECLLGCVCKPPSGYMGREKNRSVSLL